MRGGQGLLVSALAQCLWSQSLLAASPTSALEPWIERLYRLAESLRAGNISPAQWQLQMDLLYSQVDLPALLRNVDFDRLRDELPKLGRHEVFVGTPLRGENTAEAERRPAPGQLSLINKIAHVQRGACIPPHGHSNMVSAFLVVSGQFRARQYDALKWDEAAGHMWILPSMDAVQSAGQWNSISDERSNVHWLEALTDDTYLFSTKMAYLQADKPTRGRIPIDTHRGQEVGRGVLQVPIITSQESEQIYNR